MSEPKALAEVVGDNVRHLRGDFTADALARTIRQMFELKWDTGRIAGLENGRASPTATTLFIVSQALSELTRSSILVADLVRSPEYVEVGGTAIRSDRIADALSGEAVELKVRDFIDAEQRSDRARHSILGWAEELKHLPNRLGELPTELIQRVESQASEAEYRVAKSLGVSTIRLTAESARLWGDSFSVERDRRAGAGANAQQRGRVSRELKAELKAVIDGDD